MGQDSRSRVPLGQRKEPSQAELNQAAQAFEVYLREREAKYEEVKPSSGMISVPRAMEIAEAHNKMAYDEFQKLKIELVNDVYKITFWRHRRPLLTKTSFAVIVDVDAWTGEVFPILISAD